MKKREDALPTRTSLLRQVQNEAARTRWEAGWEEFYSIYRPLIFGVARQAGLNAEEAEDVVQDVMAELRGRISAFEPDGQRAPFKAWLLRMVRWRITDKLRDRLPVAEGERTEGVDAQAARPEDSTGAVIEEQWEEAWRQRILEEALEQVRTQADARQFQIFRVVISQKIRAQEVAKSFGVSVMQVYLAKHRIAKLLKREVQRLEKVMERGLRG